MIQWNDGPLPTAASSDIVADIEGVGEKVLGATRTGDAWYNTEGDAYVDAYPGDETVAVWQGGEERRVLRWRMATHADGHHTHHAPHIEGRRPGRGNRVRHHRERGE